MNILIVYASTEGHTQKIAGHMQEHFLSDGHRVELADVNADPSAPSGFDLVLIGGSLHVWKHRVLLTNYIREHAIALNSMRTAFYSVSLGMATGDKKDLDEARRTAEAFVHSSGWMPGRVELMAGALKCASNDFFRMMVMKKLPPACEAKWLEMPDSSIPTGKGCGHSVMSFSGIPRPNGSRH